MSILLSKRFSQKILSQGVIDSRIVWVRIEGPVCPLFVVSVYVPHKLKKTVTVTKDVIHQIDVLLTNCKHSKPSDCVVLLGDFNCELQPDPLFLGIWDKNEYLKT